MSKKNNQNQNANQNQQNTGNGKETKAKKPGLILKIKTAGNKHPKLTKAVSITTKVVVTGLAAVGGAGLVMAVNDRKTSNKASSLPTIPNIPAPAVPAAPEDQAE